MTRPRKELGVREDLGEDIDGASATESLTAREDKGSNGRGHKFEGTPANDCLTCGGSYINRKLHPVHLIRGEQTA